VLLVVWEVASALAEILEASAMGLGEKPELIGTDGYETWFRQRIERSAYNAALDLLSILSEFDLLHVACDVRSLADIGVSYRPECCGETWRSWSVIVRRMAGDCEDLAAAHAAWLRVQGLRARAIWSHHADIGEGQRMYHAVVETPDGQIDIARELGMRPGLSCDVGPCGQACPYDARKEVLR